MKVAYELLNIHSNNELAKPIIEVVKNKEDLMYILKNPLGLVVEEEISAKLLNKYTHEYLAQRGLIVVILQEPSSSISHSLEGVILKEKVLTVNIVRLAPEMMTEDLAWWMFLIEGDREVFINADIKLNIKDTR